MSAPLRLSALALAAMLASLATSCAPATSDRAAEPPPPTYLVVENQSTLQVTVYVLRNGHRQRLGNVSGLSTTRLRIPDSIIFGPTPLRFEVDPLASRQAPISEQITVTPGEEVHLRVPSTVR